MINVIEMYVDYLNKKDITEVEVIIKELTTHNLDSATIDAIVDEIENQNH